LSINEVAVDFANAFLSRQARVSPTPRKQIYLACLAGRYTDAVSPSFRKLALVALVVLGQIAACGHRNPPSVLLITLDTTRVDRLGCYGRTDAGTANLDALAQRGTLFEQAYAPSPLTLPSHASMLTGTYPLYHGVRDNGSYQLSSQLTTLAESMQQGGYRTAAFVGAYPVASQFGLDQGFDLYDDEFGRRDGPHRLTFSERPAEEVVASAVKWLADVNGEERFFVWVHLFDPHVVYDPPEPFASRYPRDPYQGEIAYVDASLESLFDALQAAGRLERTVIVVAADHGEALGEHGEGAHAPLINNTTMRIPLLMAGPGVPAGMRLEPTVRLIDVMPTLLEMAGLPTPVDVQGESLSPLWNGSDVQPRTAYLETLWPRLHYGWSELRGLVHGEWKIIEAPDSPNAAPGLFNVISDPGEKENLEPGEWQRVAELRDEMTQIREASAPAEPFDAQRSLSREDREQLAALGYVALNNVPATERADPRVQVELLRDYMIVSNHIVARRFEQAEALLLRLRERDPDGLGFHEQMGKLYMELGRRDPRHFTRAVEELNMALAINPRLENVWVNLAKVHWLRGKPGEAVTCYERARKIAPQGFVVELNYASALAAANRPDAALERYESLLAQHPELLRDHPDVAQVVAALRARRADLRD
jgi:choline-sulfatase